MVEPVGYDRTDIHNNSERARSAVQRIENATVLHDQTRADLLSFMKFKRGEAGASTVERNARCLWVVFTRFLKGVNSQTIDKNIVQDLSARINESGNAYETKRDYKRAFKEFMVHIGKETEVKKFSVSKGMKTEQDKRVMQKDTVTETMIMAMVKNCRHPRDIAMVALAWDSGARVKELLNLRYKDIEIDKEGMKVTLGSGKGYREIYLIFSRPYVSNWLASHPTKNRNDWLWVCYGNTHYGEKLSYRTYNKWFKSLAQKASIPFKFYPYLLRSSRATWCAEHGWTEAQLCQFFGWTIGSREAARYVKKTGKLAKTAMRETLGLDKRDEKEILLVPQICRVCGTTNPPIQDAKRCMHCGSWLDLVEANKSENDLRGSISALQENQALLAELLLANNDKNRTRELATKLTSLGILKPKQ